MRNQSKPGTKAASAALIFISTLFALILAELALRLTGVSFPLFSSFTPPLGDALLPHAEGWYTREGYAYVEINSDGLRDREHTLDKPEGVIRIAVLGDSYAEARQVPQAQTFWAIAEDRLQSCKALEANKVEVINFGVSGYGTAQELLTLRHKAWKYSPDFVLLAFVTGNDVRNNSKALQKGNRPYFVFHGDQLQLDNSYMEATSYRLRTSRIGQMAYYLLAHSRVAQLIYQVSLLGHQRKQQKIEKTGADIAGFETGLDSNVYKIPSTPEWIEAWRVTEAILGLMQTEIKERGSDLLVVTLSSSIQVNPDAKVRERFKTALGVEDLFYPDRRIADFASRQGIHHLTLAPYLRSWAETNGWCLHGFSNTTPCTGHWNQHGHRAAGERIASWICEEIL